MTWALYSRVLRKDIPAGEDRGTPVHSVSWLDALRWCNALSSASTLSPAYDLDDNDIAWNVSADGFRLPTEAEWEWEWCWDYSDPARYADYRVLRGGGWADKYWSVRASVRRGTMPGARLDDVGFRVAQGAAGNTADHAGQGWSQHADEDRAKPNGVAPMGWTPLRA